jgi:AraC-like DNA-binding protein
MPRHVGWYLLPAGAYLAILVGRTAFGFDTRVPFVWILPVALGFTAVCIVTLVGRAGQRRTGLVPAEWVVAFAAGINVAQIVRMEFGHIAQIRAVVPIVLTIGFLAATVFFVWRAVTSTSIPPPARVTPRYERSGLGDPEARELLQRIEQALARDRLFARPDLTLAQLAAAAGCAPHHVSEVLNRYARLSFHDLINRRRVDDVKAQLLDPAGDRFTIEGIGVSAGFGSRSALYAAFRRFEGMTPTAFRASRRPPG